MYSHLKHISAFFELNMQTHENKDDHRIKYAIPAFYMNEMAYCFTTMSIAVTSIKAMIVCKETKKILDERKQVSPYYIQTEVRLYYNKEVNHKAIVFMTFRSCALRTGFAPY